MSFKSNQQSRQTTVPSVTLVVALVSLIGCNRGDLPIANSPPSLSVTAPQTAVADMPIPQPNKSRQQLVTTEADSPLESKTDRLKPDELAFKQHRINGGTTLDFLEEHVDRRFAEWQAQAEAGMPIAQYFYGLCFNLGVGVEENVEEALEWYRKAAKQGYASAQFELGTCYHFGEGVPVNPVEAVTWYRKAAEQGYLEAQINLGVMYLRGTERDPQKALEWFRKAADQGSPNAQNKVGLIYSNGTGVEVNYAEALKWFRKAAEQKYAAGQYHLGLAYHKGEGVAADFDQALHWYLKAAEQGHASAAHNIGAIYSLRSKYESSNREYLKALALQWNRKGFALAGKTDNPQLTDKNLVGRWSRALSTIDRMTASIYNTEPTTGYLYNWIEFRSDGTMQSAYLKGDRDGLLGRTSGKGIGTWKIQDGAAYVEYTLRYVPPSGNARSVQKSRVFRLIGGKLTRDDNRPYERQD